MMWNVKCEMWNAEAKITLSGATPASSRVLGRDGGRRDVDVDVNGR